MPADVGHIERQTELLHVHGEGMMRPESTTANYPWNEHPDLSSEMRALYGKLRARVFEVSPDISESVFRTYLAFVINDEHAMVVKLYKRSLQLNLWTPVAQLDDPHGVAEDISGKWGNWKSGVNLSSEDQLDAVMHLVRQSLLDQFEP